MARSDGNYGGHGRDGFTVANEVRETRIGWMWYGITGERTDVMGTKAESTRYPLLRPVTERQEKQNQRLEATGETPAPQP